MNNKPDDVRRDLYNLRELLETGQYVDDTDGNEIFQMLTSTRRAEEMKARLREDGPLDSIQIKTPTGWYQIEIGDTLVIRSLDAFKSIVIYPQSSNAIELTTR